MNGLLAQPSAGFTLLAFLAVLGPLIFLHELGHYWVGRWCGIRADIFSIGFGREVAGWTDRRGTRWKVGWMPLGGYVQFAGDADAVGTPSLPTGAPPVPGSFAAAALWKRALTVLAGPAANFLVAIVILAGFALSFGKFSIPPVVGTIKPASPAAVAGLRAGDRIVSIDGRAIDGFVDIPMAVMHRPGERLAIVIERGGAQRTIALTPAKVVERDRFGNAVESAKIGITPASGRSVPVSLAEAPGVAVHQAWGMTRQMAEVVGQLLTGNRSVKDLGGPLKIAKASGEQASLGFAALIFFAALISLNLGFMNLLPLPMLDGGHLLFYGIEAVRRRPVSVATQHYAFRLGFVALAGLMIVVTFNDLASFGLFEKLAGLIG